MDIEYIPAENSALSAQLSGSCLHSDASRFEIPADEGMLQMLAVDDYSRQMSHLVLSQLQPHFLFNVFNMIYYMCGKDTETARSMINDCSTYLRSNMGALQNPSPIPLEQELERVQLYLRFEQMRFRDRFRMEYDLADTDFSLPPLTLQPLVENAVRHGVCPLPDGGVVRIESADAGAYHVVRIIDNGVGFDPSATAVSGRNNLGLGVIRARLEQLCGGELLVHSAPGEGTIAEVRIPKEAAK